MNKIKLFFENLFANVYRIQKLEQKMSTLELNILENNKYYLTQISSNLDNINFLLDTIIKEQEKQNCKINLINKQ